MSDKLPEVYAGLSGAHLEVDSFDLGQGVTISKTYAHLMAPYIVAFSEPAPGKPHPGPWQHAPGGSAFDIRAQIHVPLDFCAGDWQLDKLNTVWLIVALIRLRSTPAVIAHVLSTAPLNNVSSKSIDQPIRPFETCRYALAVQKSKASKIREADLEWIKKHWIRAGHLYGTAANFKSLLASVARSPTVEQISFAVFPMWAALEGIFSPNRAELRFRLSANIASFLEKPGPARLELQKHVAKLYDKRSAFVHGREKIGSEFLMSTYSVAKRATLAIIEQGRVPSQEHLQNLLLGVDCED